MLAIIVSVVCTLAALALLLLAVWLIDAYVVPDGIYKKIWYAVLALVAVWIILTYALPKVGHLP